MPTTLCVSLEPSVRELVRITRSRSATRQERLAAGRQLARLGDPRPGVLNLEPAWCVVDAGVFVLGSAPGDRQADPHERPAHLLRLPAFRIARYPVTNAQWRRFIQAGGYSNAQRWAAEGWEALRRPGRRAAGFWCDETQRDDYINCPVVGVSWYEALAYSRWLSSVLHYEVRLCTEAEWEKVARGVDGRLYPFGDDLDPEAVHASESSPPAAPAPVGCYPRGESPWGVEDMVGNTYAWTSSRWGAAPGAPTFAYPYRTDDGREDLASGDFRVVRGGAWSFPLRNVRCAYRGKDHPGDAFDNLGIRLVSGA
jgi:formylglycine-generating enzyme required for sulfatase activity